MLNMRLLSFLVWVSLGSVASSGVFLTMGSLTIGGIIGGIFGVVNFANKYQVEISVRR